MSNFCFATMAVGAEYVILAQKLLKDINTYCPDVPTYILTDRSESFSDFKNIICVDFVRTGFWYIYHEKRQVIEAVSKENNICLFLDADCRLVDRPPIEKFIALPPGVYGAYLQTFIFKFEAELGRYDGRERFLKNTPKRRERLLTEICNQFKLPFWECNFIQEAAVLFVPQNTKGAFFRVWEYIGNYLSIRLFEWGEGFAMGIAAKHLGIATGEIPELADWLFKDLLTPVTAGNTEKYRRLIQERSNIENAVKKSKWEKMKKHSVAFFRLAIFVPKWYLVLYHQQKTKALSK